MWAGLRKIAYFFSVLIIAAGIYLAFYAEKEVQQNVLEYSLNLMGEKLLAMVPEGEGKDKLSEMYEGFKQRAVEGELAPEQIETVAANILNVSNSDSSLTPEQAEAVLRSAMMVPRAGMPPAPPLVPGEERSFQIPPTAPERWQHLGKRVKAMFEFNEHMHRAMREQAFNRRELARKIRFRVKNGLNLALDTRLRPFMEEKEFQQVREEMKALEKERLLHWHENLSEELEREMTELRQQLESMQESLNELKDTQFLESLEGLEALKNLEHLKQIPYIDADSIRKVVKKSLEEAGVRSRKKQN
ncbi:MAG: hypothetical protein ACE5HS_08905 [bacterium]